MDLNLRWYLCAIGIFILLNGMALLGAMFFPRKKWNIEAVGFHYTSLIFQVCGVIYALFVGFIVWDVWERFDAVKHQVQLEAEYILDIYQDSSAFGEQMEKKIHSQFSTYLNHVIENEWPKMEIPKVFVEGDAMVDGIWKTYYDYSPTNRKQEIWYQESISKLDKFALARLTRIFNNANSVGALRWCLLIGGGLFLLSIPCFFRVKSHFLKFVLIFYLANIISFLLVIIFSLDHPFIGNVEIDYKPLKYVLKKIEANPIPQ